MSGTRSLKLAHAVAMTLQLGQARKVSGRVAHWPYNHAISSGSLRLHSLDGEENTASPVRWQITD